VRSRTGTFVKRIPRVGWTALAVAFWTTGAVSPEPLLAQRRPVGREAAEGLRYPELEFRPASPVVHEVRGVPVFFLESHTLPLVTVFARFKGGFGRFPRDMMAAATALPSILRYGGSVGMSPDSVDRTLEQYAIQTSFGGGGEGVFSSVNTLTEHLDVALDMWSSLLARPAFDSAQIEIWRGREMESVRRRGDDPARLAFSEFNRLLYGDHPIGWEMEAGDLVPGQIGREVLAELHDRIVCPRGLTLGVTGDVTWSELRPRIEAMLARWPACSGDVPPSPVPDIRQESGIFVIPRKSEQSVIVMAHAVSLRLEDSPEYFAAQIGNSILGGGGFSSRLLSRVRTEEGYAYSASSLWTTPRNHDGLLGAITRTRPENTVPAIRLILDTMEELRILPPSSSEVETAVERIVNGFVFNFESPAQIVSRRMFYLAQGLPDDWLERFLDGVERVDAAGVHEVLARHIRPEDMIVLIVGDPDRIGRDALEALGPVTILEIDDPATSFPSGSQRSRR